MALMNKDNINEGKSLILKEAYSKLNYGCTGDGKFDCYDSENSAFLCIFRKCKLKKSAHCHIVQITIQ